MSGIKIVEFETHAKVSFDADVAYIYIQPQRAGENGAVKSSVEMENIVLDFDTDGRLFGIEFLNTENVPKFILDAKVSKDYGVE
jgi:uncharacterized protein YuzE